MKNNYKWIALSCTSLGALLSVLSGGTLIIALPDIMKNLKAGMQIIMWIVMGYMLIITIFVPAIGRIADIIGRKKLYVSGFIIFTIGSLVCSISQNGTELLLSRLIQAIGGSLLIANSAPIVTDAFPKNELGQALGINTMIISVAFVLGPILGGFLLEFSWRSVFYFNVPIGIIGTIWSLLQLKELDILPQHQKFDWQGTITFTFGLLSFLIALTFGGLFGWFHPLIIVLFIFSVIIMLLFVYIEIKSKEPMLDLRLFKSRLLFFAYSSNMLNAIARGAITFLLLFYFQGIKAMDPITAGILLSPFVLPQIIISPISGWLSDKYGSRELSSAGLLISAIGTMGLIWINPDTSITELVVWMSIAGIGSGLFFAPNTKAIMANVPVHRRGIAAGVRTMLVNAGMVISIGVSMAIILSSITPEAFEGLFTGTQVGSKGIIVSDFIHGLRIAFILSFIISLVAAFISYLRGKQPVWVENNNAVIGNDDIKLFKILYRKLHSKMDAK